MAKRDFADRYVGQVLGLFWAVGYPLLIMGVFIFIFSVVFKVRVGGTRDVPFGYGVYMLAGLIPWLSFAEVMAKSPVAIIANAELVKQVIFPLEVVPFKVVLGALPAQLVSLGVLVVYTVAVYQFLPWTYLLLPGLLLLQIILATGVAYILAAVGVFIRDTKDFVQVLVFVGLYALPIVYLPEWVPGFLRPILYINPLSYMIWCYQDALYYGRFEHPFAWGIFMVVSIGTFGVGALLFTRLKTYFGNHL
jgi:lipopolysaccharide transport system permease protein